MRMTPFVLTMLCAAPLWSQGRQPPAPALQPFAVVQSTGLRFAGYEDDQGGFYFVWNAKGADGASQLVAQHLDATGAPMWTSGGQIVSAALASSADWHGIADGQNGLTLYWNEVDGLHAQRFRPDGSRMRPGNSVHMSTSTILQPAGVPDASGGTLVVWSEKRYGPVRPSMTSSTGPPRLDDSAGGRGADRAVLRAQHFDSDGKPRWPRGGLRVSLRPSHQTNPRVVYDDMAGRIVTWRDEFNQSSELRAQRIDGNGNLLWGQEGLRIYTSVGKSDYAKVAALGGGSAVFAWVAELAQKNQIYLQRAGHGPQVQWGEKGLLAAPTPTLYHRWNPHLRSDGHGGIWILWEDLRNQRTYQVSLNHLRADGQSGWPVGELLVAPSSGDQGKSSVIEDGQGGAWVSWIDNQAGVGLYAQHVNDAGVRLEGPAGRLIASGLSKVEDPRFVPVAPGKVALLWADRRRENEWALYWTYLSPTSVRP